MISERERVPTRWEPSDDECRQLPHSLLLAACLCGIERNPTRVHWSTFPGAPVSMHGVRPLNAAAREIFRRLEQWEKEHGAELQK